MAEIPDPHEGSLRLLTLDIWFRNAVIEKTRPCELVPVMALLYQWEGADVRWKRYLADMEAWQRMRYDLYVEQSHKILALSKVEPPSED